MLYLGAAVLTSSVCTQKHSPTQSKRPHFVRGAVIPLAEALCYFVYFETKLIMTARRGLAVMYTSRRVQFCRCLSHYCTAANGLQNVVVQKKINQ